ncbi:uncharacterized protein PGTG_05229 [Puccinia graminis f. sp. tritici CRL 75-36-700-3]|uniref:Uncharacterized protein n=1 Tax=Puccinia graminis f. sp. tritici (strain CRL 75-36-700-3 / race SCCL) TaxID=418459 RepID=E3K6H5_PUCGT|nr:uncharacterized protein PGTG_05229 [Puccinia graminis f. sp. tritici CRL 75-36-700-3]EFP80004.2 hypothetical protein PGTG_05229 [Puccinia graminis f. sp. tritici CRL 75-36-700-3]
MEHPEFMNSYLTNHVTLNSLRREYQAEAASLNAVPNEFHDPTNLSLPLLEAIQNTVEEMKGLKGGNDRDIAKIALYARALAEITPNSPITSLTPLHYTVKALVRHRWAELICGMDYRSATILEGLNKLWDVPGDPFIHHLWLSYF